jgi:hypothetical protein
MRSDVATETLSLNDRIAALRKEYDAGLASGGGAGVFVPGVRQDGMRAASRQGMRDIRDQRLPAQKRGYVGDDGQYLGERTAGVSGVHQELVPRTIIDPKTSEERTVYEQKWRKDRAFNNPDNIGSVRMFAESLEKAGRKEEAELVRKQILPRYIGKTAEEQVRAAVERPRGGVKAAEKVARDAAAGKIPRPVMRTFEQMARDDASALAKERMADLLERRATGRAGLVNTRELKKIQAIRDGTYGKSLEETKLYWATQVDIAAKRAALEAAESRNRSAENVATITGRYNVQAAQERGRTLLEAAKITAQGRVQSQAAESFAQAKARYDQMAMSQSIKERDEARQASRRANSLLASVFTGFGADPMAKFQEFAQADPQQAELLKGAALAFATSKDWNDTQIRDALVSMVQGIAPDYEDQFPDVFAKK